MWGPLNERIITKVIHLLNRYFTEAVLIYCLYGLYMHFIFLGYHSRIVLVTSQPSHANNKVSARSFVLHL